MFAEYFVQAIYHDQDGHRDDGFWNDMDHGRPFPRIAFAVQNFLVGNRKGGDLMADHIGIVIQSEEKDLLRIAADRKGACGGCDHRGGGCKSCLAGADKVESQAINPVGAKPGDLVKLQIPSASLYTGAALLHLLPVVGLLAGAFFGDWAFGSANTISVFGAAVGAFSGLTLGYAVVIAKDRGKDLRRRWMPTITQVIQTNIRAREGARSAGTKASCCG